MISYVILTSSATAIGPIVAGFVIPDTVDTWRNFTWVCTALARANLILIFLAYPESTYHRTADQIAAVTLQSMENNDPNKLHRDASHVESLSTIPQGIQHVEHVDIHWRKVWFSLPRYDSETSFPKAFLRPFTSLLYPRVLWAVFVYGTCLASQIILMYVLKSITHGLDDPILITPASLFQAFF